MKKRMKLSTVIRILFVLVVLGGGIIGTEIEMARKNEAVWFDSYPMANQHIRWEGAGYNGGH